MLVTDNSNRMISEMVLACKWASWPVDGIKVTRDHAWASKDSQVLYSAVLWQWLWIQARPTDLLYGFQPCCTDNPDSVNLSPAAAPAATVTTPQLDCQPASLLAENIRQTGSPAQDAHHTPDLFIPANHRI